MRKRRFLLFAPAVAVGLAAIGVFLAIQGPLGTAQEAEEPFAYGLMRAVNVADGEIYPDQQVAITLNGGYASHDNNVIITSGLPNVGVGSYAYFKGREEGPEGNAITSWQWELVSQPAWSEAALESADTQFPRLLTDKSGTYEVKVTATNDLAATGSSVITVTAGTYVGVQQCATCHIGNVMPDQVTQWAETGHGTKFEVQWGSYTADRDYCAKCHTTGYNEADQAEGFDDLAHLSGWDASEGSLLGFLKDGGWELDWVLLSPMGDLANIQCEQCHGPGSIHTESLSYDPGVCGQCHGQPEEWAESAHGSGNYSGGLSYGSRASCSGCHSGEGFVEVQIRGNDAVFPYEGTDEEPATLSFDPSEQPTIVCATCHDPHAATYPQDDGRSKQLRYQGDVTLAIGATVQAGESAVCVQCHGGRRDADYKQNYSDGNSSRAVHHNLQAPVFYGIEDLVFTFGNTLGSSAHPSAVGDGCVQCHMAPNLILDVGADGNAGTRDDETAPNIGGHSWNITGDVDGQHMENTENACGSCHSGLTTVNRTARGDYDGDGTVEGIQDEVHGLLDLIIAELPAAAKTDSGGLITSGINNAGLTELQRQALWNVHVVEDDGSAGVHNTDFIVSLLQVTYKALTGVDVPGATLR